MKSAIKKSVRDQAYNVRRELNHKDFTQVSKITFDAKDPSNLIGKVFKFKDYAPAVFKVCQYYYSTLPPLCSAFIELIIPFLSADATAEFSNRRTGIPRVADGYRLG